MEEEGSLFKWAYWGKVLKTVPGTKLALIECWLLLLLSTTAGLCWMERIIIKRLEWGEDILGWVITRLAMKMWHLCWNCELCLILCCFHPGALWVSWVTAFFFNFDVGVLDSSLIDISYIFGLLKWVSVNQ